MFGDRGLYEGETKRVRTKNLEELHVRHGYGKYTYPSGSFVYEGDWVNGVKHGNGVFLGSNGVRYEGEFYRGEMTGAGIRTWPDGSRYEGQFEEGEMHGRGRFTRKDTCERYEGEWSSNQRCGKGELLFNTGDTYSGEFQANRPNGDGVYQWADGCSYEGNWSDGKRTGLGREVLVNGDEYFGGWQHDFKHGKGKWVSAQHSLTYDGLWDFGTPTGQPRLVCVRVVKPPDVPEDVKRGKGRGGSSSQSGGRPRSKEAVHSSTQDRKAARKRKHTDKNQPVADPAVSSLISECVVDLAELQSAHPKLVRGFSRGGATPRAASRPNTPASRGGGPTEFVYPTLDYSKDVVTVKNADLVYDGVIEVPIGSYLPPLFLCLCGEDGALVDSEVGRRVKVKLSVVNPETLNFKVKKTKNTSSKTKSSSKASSNKDADDAHGGVDGDSKDKVYFCNCHNYPKPDLLSVDSRMSTPKSRPSSVHDEKKPSKTSGKKSGSKSKGKADHHGKDGSSTAAEDDNGLDQGFPCTGLCATPLKGMNAHHVVEIEKSFDGPVLMLDGLIIAAGSSPGTVVRLEVIDSSFDYSYEMCIADAPHPASTLHTTAESSSNLHNRSVRQLLRHVHPASLPDPPPWTKGNFVPAPGNGDLLSGGRHTSSLLAPTPPFVSPLAPSSFLFQAVDTSDHKKKGRRGK